MRRLCFALVLCAGIILRCGADDSEEPDVGLAIYTFAAAGVFNNFCGAAVEHPVGVNSVTIEAGVFHWITFLNEFGRTYEVTVNEATDQNVLIRNIDCTTGSSLDSLTNTSATGQTEAFLTFPSGRGIILLCSEGCNAPVNFTIPASPAPPQ